MHFLTYHMEACGKKHARSGRLSQVEQSRDSARRRILLMSLRRNHAGSMRNAPNSLVAQLDNVRPLGTQLRGSETSRAPPAAGFIPTAPVSSRCSIGTKSWTPQTNIGPMSGAIEGRGAAWIQPSRHFVQRLEHHFGAGRKWMIAPRNDAECLHFHFQGYR